VNTKPRQADRSFLARALTLAENGRGRVSPNPLVGAVMVRDGEVIGEGFHAELGDLHAERAALADCRQRGEDPTGATLYVSLEPCAHQGRQPPCVEAILEAGIARVVIASEDPSEKAAGQIFDVGGASVVRQSHLLDRHWRNIRTLASHNPSSYKAQALGALHVRGTRLPGSGYF